MEVIWASNQSPFFIEALAQWMKFIIIFVPSRNVISRSHVVILLALFHVDYDCTFGIKNVIIFHQTQKNLHLVYQMSIDKYVRRSSTEQCCQLWLSKKWKCGCHPAIMNYFERCHFQNFDNVSPNPFHTVKQVKLKTLSWKNQNLLGNQRNFSRKKVTIPVRPLYGRNRANPHFSCPYANWIK